MALLLVFFICVHCVLGSEVAEGLMFLVPVHSRSSLLVAAGQGLEFSLSSGGTETQATVHEGVQNAPVVLIVDLQYTQTYMFHVHTHTRNKLTFSALFVTSF